MSVTWNELITNIKREIATSANHASNHKYGVPSLYAICTSYLSVLRMARMRMQQECAKGTLVQYNQRTGKNVEHWVDFIPEKVILAFREELAAASSNSNVTIRREFFSKVPRLARGTKKREKYVALFWKNWNEIDQRSSADDMPINRRIQWQLALAKERFDPENPVFHPNLLLTPEELSMESVKAAS